MILEKRGHETLVSFFKFFIIHSYTSVPKDSSILSVFFIYSILIKNKLTDDKYSRTEKVVIGFGHKKNKKSWITLMD
jgi:hypothetical protein